MRASRVTAETVGQWESGERMPSFSQLERLALRYRRPVAVFFFPAPPEEAGIEQKLRALPAQAAQSLPPHIRHLVRSAMAMQINLAQLHGDERPDALRQFRSAVKNLTGRDNLHKLAAVVRKLLGISLKQQFSWRDPEVAFNHWRQAVEECGIWVFKNSFRGPDNSGDRRYCGFCLDDARYPLIYINNEMAKQRQIFTLFHELAHLIIGKGGVDFRESSEADFAGQQRQEEIFCNAFAAAFLVPGTGEAEMGKLPDDRQILDLARKYSVSREVILRKYLDRGKVSQDYYDKMKRQWQDEWHSIDNNAPAKAKPKGGNPYLNKKAYLGSKYMRVAFAKYYAQQIDEYQLAIYLDTKIGQLSILEGYMSEQDQGKK